MKLKLIKEITLGEEMLYEWQVFCSLLPDGDGYTGVLREHNPSVYAESAIMRVSFTPDLVEASRSYVCAGQDPRIFRIDPHNLAFVTWIAAGNDWHHAAVSLEQNVASPLWAPGYRGKNWLPVVAVGNFYIIRSLDPTILYRMESGKAVERIGSSWVSDKVGEYRGGSAPVYDAGTGLIEGWGHRTRNGNLHTPFFYTIDPDAKIVYTDVDYPEGLEPGYGIVDPTSQWDDRVVCCCTTHGWNKQHKTFHGLFEVVKC